MAVYQCHLLVRVAVSSVVGGVRRAASELNPTSRPLVAATQQFQRIAVLILLPLNVIWRSGRPYRWTYRRPRADAGAQPLRSGRWRCLAHSYALFTHRSILETRTDPRFGCLMPQDGGQFGVGVTRSRASHGCGWSPPTANARAPPAGTGLPPVRE
jgi:hypothetical protein